MKKIFIHILLVILLSFNATKSFAVVDTLNTKQLKTEVKLNSLIAVGIINPAVEFKISKRFTFQLEGLATFNEKNFLGTGHPLTMVGFFLEGRYYIKPNFSGFYVGANCGAATFRMSKGAIPIYGNSYDNIDTYQMGYSIMAGATIGYKLRLTTHWALDFYWSGGYQHARYEGYIKHEDDKYVPYIGLNASAEWLLAYKGGISVSYRW